MPLSSKTFPYKALVPEILSPVVSVVLHGKTARIPVRALVDSGADYTFLPIELAQPLGIVIADCRQEQCNTAGGTTTQHIWEDGLDAEVQGMGVTIHLKTAFSETPLVLVGREDFFAAFRVTFDQRGCKFTLERY